MPDLTDSDHPVKLALLKEKYGCWLLRLCLRLIERGLAHDKVGAVAYLWDATDSQLEAAFCHQCTWWKAWGYEKCGNSNWCGPFRGECFPCSGSSFMPRAGMPGASGVGSAGG